MNIDQDLIKQLAQKTGLRFTLQLGDRVVPLDDATVSAAEAPVSGPTTRGGVYRTDRHVYKVKVVTSDHTILPMLTGKMLGPNTEFEELEVKTVLDSQDISLYGNLVNTVQAPGRIELHMILVGTRSG